MSSLVSLACVKCRQDLPKTTRLLRCPQCQGLLDPRYDYDAIRSVLTWEIARQRPRSIWRWRELLPIEDEHCIVSLGEGDTPLVRSIRVGPTLGLRHLHIMNDGMNPTGSLKDRSMAVVTSKAVEFGYRVIACDSSGNKAASMSAYAARAGLVSLVFCPNTTPPQKLLQIIAYGGRLVIVDTDRDGVARLYSNLMQRRKAEWYDSGVSNPFRYEGKKTYAYEIAEAFAGRAPDWILHPAAGSMSVVKNWKGFGELERLGLVRNKPRLVAVQSQNCAPIVAAYQTDRRTVSSVEHRPTIAGGLSIPNPGDLGDLTLQVIRESGGTAVAVTEDEIRWGMQELWREGIFSEPTGAVTVPALHRLVEEGKIRSGDTVVCIVTGTGFKDLHSVEDQISIPRPIPATQSAIEEVTQRLLE
ncbi:MAG: threonine synthase [candidate division NC10 bacterium RBG_16_65_8]|nr:MAG: threonine synthase [candidate division NC10 bacterium RBG_16_65_8]